MIMPDVFHKSNEPQLHGNIFKTGIQCTIWQKIHAVQLVKFMIKNVSGI